MTSYRRKSGKPILKIRKDDRIPSIRSYLISDSSGDWLNKITRTNSSYCNIKLLFHKRKRCTLYHNCKWLQLSMTRQMQYKFLYPVHNITTVQCAVPLSLLTAVLNTEQCAALRQKAINNTNSVCNYSNGDMLRHLNHIALKINIISRPYKCTAFERKYN
jgi:hypothetical protein